MTHFCLVRAAMFSLAVLTVPLLPGCTTHPGSGRIVVDHPQVFRRERLLNRRLQERQWLEDQLSQPVTSSIQGSIDSREFTGLAAALKANFDPLGGAQSEAALQNTRRSQRITDLEDRLRIEVLKQQIYAVKNETSAPPPNSGGSTNGGAAGSSTNGLVPAVATFNFDIFAATNLPSVINPTNRVILGAAARLTSVQTLDDRLAYRNTIQALLRDQELDDTHDLDGMALYTLKLDISVLPGANNGEFGQVSLQLSNKDFSWTANDFTRWRESLTKELREECLNAERRFYMGYLSDDELAQLMSLATRFIADKKTVQDEAIKAAREIVNNDDRGALKQEVKDFVQSQTRGNLDKLYSSMAKNHIDGTTREKLQVLASSGLPDVNTLVQNLAAGRRTSDGALGVAWLIRDRYQYALDQALNSADPGNPPQQLLVKVSTNGIPIGTNKSGSMLYYAAYPSFECRDAFKFFTNIASQLLTNTPYVLIVEPKEYAQNLSDVAARQRVLSLAASLSALIPQISTSLGLEGDYVRNSQQMFDTIKRQPLLVGFASGASGLGWVVGPKFDIPVGKTKVGWSHTPIQHSVQASVVVPGWWTTLELTGTNCWLKANGNERRKALLGVDLGLRGVKNAQTNHLTVRLPGDYSAITRALLSRSELCPEQPSILPRWDEDDNRRCITVEEGADETILIRGRELWRNPEVYLGSQKGKEPAFFPTWQD